LISQEVGFFCVAKDRKYLYTRTKFVLSVIISMKSHTQKGLTTIEILIIIIIIGILSVVLISKMNTLQGRARDVTRKGNIQQLTAGLTSYQLTNTSYPSWSGAVSQSLNLLAPLYLRSLPKDPSWTSVTTTNWSQSAIWDYLYISLESNKSYVLISVSEWGGRNANWISDVTSTSMTWSSPGLITSADTVDMINKFLCISMEDGVLSRVGNTCTADYTSHQAKYIVASK